MDKNTDRHARVSRALSLYYRNAYQDGLHHRTPVYPDDPDYMYYYDNGKGDWVMPKCEGKIS